MSVLVEALTMVIRKDELDARYPDGSAAFVEATQRLQPPPRYACDDGRLLNLSFYGPQQVAPCVELLGARRGRKPRVAVALVDQELGPTSPCRWLEWARNEEGYAFAWLAGTDPGELATDESWSPERSRALVRRDLAEESDRLFPLAEEGGLATWLELATGKELIGLANPPAARVASDGEESVSSFLGDAALEPVACHGAQEQEVSAEADISEEAQAHAGKLREQIRAILDAEELRYRPWAAGWLEVPFTAEVAVIVVRLAPADNGDYVRLYATSDVRVPSAQRSAACELLTLANWGLPLGNFEMDLSDGEVVLKGTIYLGKTGELTHEQLVASIYGASCLFEHYYPALMRLIYGGLSAADAIAEVEK